MSKWEENSILIERFLDGDFSAEEKLHFEKLLAEDAKLAAELEMQKQIRKDIRLSAERKELREKLNQFHQTYFSYPGSSEARVVPFKKRSIISIVSIAAAVSVIIVCGAIGIYHFRMQQLQAKSDYGTVDRELKPSVSNNAAKNHKDHEKKSNSIINKHFRAATAFALSSDGWVITSYHTVKDKKNVVLERVGDSMLTLNAEVRFYNKKLDIALLKVNDGDFSGFGAIPYSFAEGDVVIAQDVFTLGYPKDDIVFTEGSISSLSGYNMDTLAYQAGIVVNPGNSGAPLFNVQGDVVGVIAGKHLNQEGATFAIKSKYFLNMLKHISLRKGEPAIQLPSKNLIKNKKTTEQVKDIEPFVFIIKA